MPFESKPMYRTGPSTRAACEAPHPGQALAHERRAVERVCRRLDEVLGPRGRRLMYTHMLAERDLMLRFNNQGVPAWEDRMMRIGWPLAVRYAQRELGIRPGVEVEDEASVFR